MATVGSPGDQVVAAEPPYQLAEPRPDPVRQLAGRLAGEGESEDLLGPRVRVGDQPHHPGGHRLGLARAGPGDDQQRLDRRGDDLGLLRGGGRQVQQLGQLDRGVPGTGVGAARRPGVKISCHRSPDGPCRTPGSDVRTGQTRHLLFTTASNVEAAIVFAVRFTRACAHVGSSASPSGGWICSRAALVSPPSWTRAAPPGDGRLVERAQLRSPPGTRRAADARRGRRWPGSTCRS